jgi:hypothetical protein
MSDMLITIVDHQSYINKYIDWVFKDKRDFVILKSYNNKVQGLINLYVALPIKERTFVSSNDEVFDVNTLDKINFPYSKDLLIKQETIYTGNMFDFYNFPIYLAKTIFSKKVPNINNSYYYKEEKVSIFRDYTTTLTKQQENYAFVKGFHSPDESIDSIYRLLQRKYITIVSLTFKLNLEPNERYSL